MGVIGGQGAERFIDCTADSVTVIAPGPFLLDVSGTGLLGLGGTALNAYTPGVLGGTGPNTVGLLVRIWGQVTQRDTTGLSYFYIDDGSGLMDGTTTGGEDNVGVRVLADPTSYSTGSYVIVTGVVSLFDSGGPRPSVFPQAGGIEVLAP